MAPADSDTEAQPTAGQEINIGRLPRHECCLALGEDQDPVRTSCPRLPCLSAGQLSDLLEARSVEDDAFNR
jgi:hypothetical protein